MIKAVLLDLDGTLLGNDERSFVGHYIQYAENYFREAAGIDGVGAAILGTMGPMLTSQDYHLTNMEVALDAIASATGVNSDALLPLFDRFYTQVFPRLRSECYTIEATIILVDYLRTLDLEVIIATNPVYPAPAIYQRLGWAGLPDDPAAYAFVTTGDNMHFLKPSPMYYAELIARAGIEPEETVMVGNSIKNDIHPATLLGLHTFHIDTDTDEVADTAEGAGSLGDFLQQVQDGWLDKRAVKPLTPDVVFTELRGNLAALFGLLENVEPRHWTAKPDPNEWSIIEIVCHLRHREPQVLRPRLELILNEDNPFIGVPPPDEPSRHACPAGGLEIAHEFVAEREKTLALLASLNDTDWSRPARHSIFSSTNLLEMAHFTAKHDRMHITQLCQTLRQCD